jgi:hypothetical protein
MNPMKSIKQENHHPHSKKMVLHGSFEEIAKTMIEKKLIEPGSHNLLIYDDLNTFREIYSQYSRAFLPQNEIILIATQYDSIDEVNNTLRLAGADVERYLNQGTLFVIDAQQGYQDTDTRATWKLAMSLLSRVKKDGRRGVSWFGDLGSFFSFEKIEELMQYELWCPQKYKDMMKTVCCYHLRDFEKLTEAQQQLLFDHHFKSIFID